MSTVRQPQGIPVGGQFAATTHAEPEASLVGVRIGAPREMTRAELVLTGQAVPENRAMSEVTRMMARNRNDLAQAVRAMDETLLNATVIQAKQVFPGAKELRLKTIRTADWRSYKTPSSITDADGNVVSAEIEESANGDWAYRKIEGSDPEDIYNAVSAISQHSEVWDNDPRCDYDHSTDEHIIYLDGRRRHES